MRYSFLILFLLLTSIVASAQRDRNYKPSIIGQRSVTTNEDEPVNIEFAHLIVVDWDNSYPRDFTLQVFDGPNYNISNNTVIPDAGYSGTLTVPVSVNDGEDDSKKFDLKVQVNWINDRPAITGQEPLSMNENESLTIRLENLVVSDPDSSYPNDFTMNLSGGSNYSVSGNTITPAVNFVGTLSVPVTVSDGNSTSPTFDLRIQVNPLNETPVITGQVALTTGKNRPITLELGHLKVTDNDNPYPAGFTLSASPGNNYTLSGNVITPASNYVGTLSVNVVVSDGISNSAPFKLQIQVTPVNDIPEITAQVPLRISEDESIAILFSYLKVTDDDNVYPNGFTLSISSGANYSVVNSNVIKPSPNFNGNLSVQVSVSDGKDVSKMFDLIIAVNGVNDAPEIVNLEAVPLTFEIGKNPIFLSNEFEAIDVDDDSLTLAEIKFNSENFRSGKDQLIFNNTSTIRGVFDSREGVLLLVGNAPISEYIDAVKSIKYNYVPAENDTLIKNKNVYISLSDGRNTSLVHERPLALRDMYVDLDIPTGFTPNGDFVNDTWSVRTLKSFDGLGKPVIRVYNKSGKLVFETTGFDKEWDGIFNGEFLPTDSYFYTIDLSLPYTKAKYNGVVTILR